MSLSEDEDDYLSADEDCLTAPPPTPALSSSFASDEQTKWTTSVVGSLKPKMTSTIPIAADEQPQSVAATETTATTTSASTGGTTTTTTTPTTLETTTTTAATVPSAAPSQYGWRIPNSKNALAARQQLHQTLVEEDDDRILPSTPKDDAKVELKTRLALDRLSQKLSQYDKNLIQKVTEDVKKVSIKPNAETNVENESARPAAFHLPTPNIPIISDLGNTLGNTIGNTLGNTLGGWSWNGASKFLNSSASLVTSQVGSVLESVVNPKPSGGSTKELQAANKPEDHVD